MKSDCIYWPSTVLLPDNLDQNPLTAFAIELPIKDLLPGTEIELSFCILNSRPKRPQNSL
jgi:hypothetical protein